MNLKGTAPLNTGPCCEQRLLVREYDVGLWGTWWKLMLSLLCYHRVSRVVRRGIFKALVHHLARYRVLPWQSAHHSDNPPQDSRPGQTFYWSSILLRVEPQTIWAPTSSLSLFNFLHLLCSSYILLFLKLTQTNSILESFHCKISLPRILCPPSISMTNCLISLKLCSCVT